MKKLSVQQITWLFIICVFCLAFLFIFDRDNERAESAEELSRRRHLVIQLFYGTGYGGAIHNFKNYVIRKEEFYYTTTKESLNTVFEITQRYLSLDNLSDVERNSIRQFKKVMHFYESNLELARAHIQDAKQNNSEVSTSFLDKLIAVDDKAALNGLAALLDNIDSNASRLQKTAQRYRQQTYVALGLVTLTLMIGISLVIGRLERSREEVETRADDLARANEELSHFAYRASHDLRAPLASVKNLAKVAEEDIESGDIAEARSAIQRIGRSSAKLEGVVGSILDLAKADVELEEALDISIQEVFDDIVERLSWMSQENDVSVSLDSSLETIKTSRARFEQILENLGLKRHQVSRPSSQEALCERESD